MLTIYQLEVTIEVITPLALETYCGSALRGAFFRALWGRFCSNREAETCFECPLNSACPVSALVAPLRDEAPRGRDIPRPYIITPSSTGKTVYAPGETYTFGFTLLGKSAKLYPYVIRAFLEMERHTLGHPLRDLQGKRGSFRLHSIHEVHPFTQQRVCLWQQGERSPEKLRLGITTEDVMTRAKQCPADAACLHFLSPTRLVADGHVLRQPDPAALVLRLAERVEHIQHEYGETGDQEERYGREWYLSLKERATSLSLNHDATRWVEAYSYSARQQQKISISGFIGEVTFAGPISDFRELLVWGELLRVGKHIVKGAGFYHVEL